MGPRAGLDRCGKSRPPPRFDPRTVQLVASRCTCYATRPTREDLGTYILLPAAAIQRSCVTAETLNGVILLTDRRSSTTVRMEGIVASLWQQWLDSRATMLPLPTFPHLFRHPSFPMPLIRRHNFSHHRMSVMELGHLLTRSGLTYLEVSSEVCHDSFCQMGNSVSLSWVVCHEAICLHVASSSSCIPAVYLEPVLFLIPLQRVNLFCNLPKCILLFFSYISSLLLLFSWRHLL